MTQFPKWNKIWLFYNDLKWDFTQNKEEIPAGAIACEYIRNSDPFTCKIKIEIIEEPLT